LNKDILKSGVQNFISEYYATDSLSVLLKKPQFEGISQKELVIQLEGKNKSRLKLPSWFKTLGIYYPKKINIEQTSSEITAAYKSELVNGKSLVDITGGFGVDSYYFSKKIVQVFHCEIDENLAEIAAHNFTILGTKNSISHAQNGIDFLAQSDTKFDWVFADPSRRDSAQKRVFKLADCSPNIPEHLDVLFSKTNRVLIKTAPLLDISLGIAELQHVKAIHVVAVNNEVKELLWVLEKDFSDAPTLTAVNLETSQQPFSFLLSEEKKAIADLGEPLRYLYEPNAAILKAGAFKTVGNRYGLKKLHEHSHLYTSDTLVNFPGRIFKIETVLPYNKKALKLYVGSKANVTTRNFSESVASIRQKYKLKDGGDRYLFFTTCTNSERLVLVTKKT